MRCFWPDPSEHFFLGNPLQKLTPVYSQKSSEKVSSSFCTPQRMWKRKRGFIILLTEQLYSPPIYDQYSLPQKTLRHPQKLTPIYSQKSPEKVLSSFCTPQRMWKRKRGLIFIILLTEQLYSPPIYDQYSLPQKTLRHPQKLTPIYSQKSPEKVLSSFCTPQRMWKRKRGLIFIILLTEQLYSPPIYDYYSFPQKTLRRQRALQKISSTGERGQNTIKEKHHIQDRTLVKGQEVKSFGPFARQNQPQTCQLYMAKCVEVPPWKKAKV